MWSVRRSLKKVFHGVCRWKMGGFLVGLSTKILQHE